MNDKYTWIPFYKEVAKALLLYKKNRAELVKWIYDDLGQVTRSDGQSLVGYLKQKNGSKITKITDIDPFSVIGIFNRNTTWDKRTELITHFKNKFELTSPIPKDFNGIPTLDNRRSFFFSWGDNNDKVITDMWDLFEKVVFEDDIADAFNQVLENGMPKYSLTMCLYWIFPEKYIALDSRNRTYLATFGFPYEFSPFNYQVYADLLQQVQQKIDSGVIPSSSFLEISHSAWIASTSTPCVWMWSGNEDTFSQDVIKAGNSAKGQLDFSTIKSKKELDKAYQNAVGNTDVKVPYAYWQLMKEVKVDDIIVVFEARKDKGSIYHLLHGWGRFTSDCKFFNDDENPIQRSVNWHSPRPSKPVVETQSNNQMFFHRLEGIEANNIIRLLGIDDSKPVETEPDSAQKYWIYAPGENASMWEWCQQNSMMCIGWNELGDLRQYSSVDEINTKLQEVYKKPDANFMNDRLAVWDFVHTLKPGDIVYSKRGKSKIVGRGVVTGDYLYDKSKGRFPNLRAIRWTHIGDWVAPHDSVLKTLTDITKYPDYVKDIEGLFAPQKGRQCWWLVAKPKIWSLAEMKNDEVQDYTLYNENGNQRRIFQNFVNAKAGDIVIGYEATPTKQIVALLEIAKENDGSRIWFRKKETLGTPVDYSAVKSVPGLEKMEFFINPNGSLFKMTEDEYNLVIDFIRELNPIASGAPVEKYGKDEFLKDVFVTEEDFDALKSLLLRKKNLILQGAPGVGKTFAAKRLAYAIMGEIDKERIEQVQFHQNYSYEDFMMGYKPNDEGGFDLRPGVFYNFCKQASAHRDKAYFFIIDEINRGNLSKIFGELLMLIESDYRDMPIKLSYRDEMFSVPSNLYIIGMMNTADRSLAMIDYALRRRFSFFEMKPGFDSEGFKNYLKGLGNAQLEKVVNAVKELNNSIFDDASLGEGFCIGHSYFCNLEKVNQQLLKEIVEYDIVPMLREYWFDSNDKFESEAQKLKDALK